ncbi:MAG: hypothetical protein ACXWLS_04820 [Myxococcaceae bacterium]
MMLSAAGCGSSTSNSAVCDNLAGALTNVTTKFAPCGTVPPIPFDKNQCVNSFNNNGCSDADKTKINSFVSCVNNLPTCSPATITAWQNSFTTCEANLNGLSSTC